MDVTIGFQKLDACVAYYFRAQGSTKDSTTVLLHVLTWHTLDTKGLFLIDCFECSFVDFFLLLRACHNPVRQY